MCNFVRGNVKFHVFKKKYCVCFFVIYLLVHIAQNRLATWADILRNRTMFTFDIAYAQTSCSCTCQRSCRCAPPVESALTYGTAKRLHSFVFHMSLVTCRASLCDNTFSHMALAAQFSLSYTLLKNVHKDLSVPDNGQTFLIKGDYEYWHYCCDNFIDSGWGCGYRTLQTICSWFINNNVANDEKVVPTINKIQRIIDEVGDKSSINTTFVESKNWIGTFEAFLVLNHLYNAPCKIIHVWTGTELKTQTDTIKNHFIEFGSPIMMGGDQDCSSKCIVGIHFGDCIHLLIVDPHFAGKAKSVEDLKKRNWVKWQNLDDFDDSSFYNLCLPQVKCDMAK